MRNNNGIVNQKAVIGKGESLQRIWIRNIIYLEGNVNYTIFHTKDEVYFSSRHLLFWKNQLVENGFDFVRIHRKYLVNREHIKEITETEVKVSNRDVLKISRRKHNKIKS